MINFDEVAAGALVNAIALVGRRLSTAVDNWRGRGRLEDISTARWFETYRLTDRVPQLLVMESGAAERLADKLRGDEIQAALQELLATRLTDAPEVQATGARHVLWQTLTSTDPSLAPIAAALAQYYDDQICALVARLEADDHDRRLLTQIRLEAFATRLIYIVGAIERHAAALAVRPNQRTEAGFLVSYRRQVIDHHGKLEPPDFDRRRRVPLGQIYVPTTITKETSRESSSASLSAPSTLDVSQLPAVLDRSVLLGDPGAGKTTAANVLMHYFASDETRLIPFLVTLRHYAAKDPPEHSIVEHIERNLNTLYQSQPPRGMIDLLLLTGRAVVIFDGLDELLDTSRRADVSTRVERFCAEYPLAPVMVTSRVVGYEQARLDPQIFATYMLGGFADEQVAEYVHKWFTQDAQAQPSDADTFLEESASVSDLRSNPLMLALLCILYRGDGSLPRNRAEVYEQCASLLFNKWDARRKIHQELRAGHLLEPALRHLAWWLFTRDNVETAVTEQELVAETSTFLHGRGFEFVDDAHAAAREFVEFCRGRMWVFTDAGTTGAGQKLYAFTHRTFLEYFAAARLAYNSDTPEQLAYLLAANIRYHGLSLVGELAIQIKDHTSNTGAGRIYAVIMANIYDKPPDLRCEILRFLVRCLRSVDPSPQRVRELTRRVTEEAVRTDASAQSWCDAMHELITDCGSYRDTVADEIGVVITETVRAGDVSSKRRGLLLAASLPDGAAPAGHHAGALWAQDADSILQSHPEVLVAAAQDDKYLRRAALAQGFIGIKQALAMPDGLNGLFEDRAGFFPDEARWGPYIDNALHDLMAAPLAFSNSTTIEDFMAIGNYLLGNPRVPWVGRPSASLLVSLQGVDAPFLDRISPTVNQLTYLGALAVIAIVAERREKGYRWTHAEFGSIREFYPYLARRHNHYASGDLPELPVPDEFRAIFQDWAFGRIDLTSSGQFD